jgi:hypothetical protein
MTIPSSIRILRPLKKKAPTDGVLRPKEMADVDALDEVNDTVPDEAKIRPVALPNDSMLATPTFVIVVFR